jgi:hypothetical protein
MHHDDKRIFGPGDFRAVLFYDNCSLYIDNETKRMLASANIKLVTFLLYTSNLFQLLDFVTFSIFKKEKGEIMAKLIEKLYVWHITKLKKALECAINFKSGMVGGLEFWFSSLHFDQSNKKRQNVKRAD